MEKKEKNEEKVTACDLEDLMHTWFNDLRMK
jgi:hypothetical protein